MSIRKGLISPVFAAVVINSLSCTAVKVSAQTVEVFRTSGLKQCSEEKPAPEKYATMLESSGVKVRSYACGSDGSLRAQVCDQDRGVLYVYEIDAAGLPKALELGFMDVKRIAGNQGYRKYACDKS